MKNVHIVSEKSFVTCQVCKKNMEIINGKHLKFHHITFDEYLLKYPGHPTITKTKQDKEIENYKRISENNKSGKTKNVKCYFCKKDHEVNINVSNTESVCKECMDNGQRSPMMIQRKENSEKTFIENYGVTNPSNLKEVRDKISQVKTEKFKDENEKNRVNSLREDTCREKYGVQNIMELPEYRIKAINNRNEKYQNKKEENK